MATQEPADGSPAAVQAGRAALTGENFGEIDGQPPNSPDLLWRARARFIDRQYEAALADLDRYLSLRPEDDAGYYWRGYAHLLLGNPPAARRDLDAACRLNPRNRSAFFLRGMYFLQSVGAHEAGVADLTRAIRLRASADAFYWRGMAFYHLQLHAAAITDFTEAMAHQPENLQLYYWRGLSAYQLQDYVAALSDLDQVLAGDPQDDSGRFWRGVALHRLGFHEPALADLDRAVAGEPDSLLRLAWRGRVCLAMAHWEQARQDFARVLAGDDAGGQGAYVIAGGLAALEQAAFACAWLQRVAQLDRRRALAAADDLDFAPIHDTVAFQEWLASLPATP